LILLDTHPLIWFTQGDMVLGSKARQVMQGAIDSDEALVSPITFWEAAMLARKGRLGLGRSVQDWAQAILENGMKVAEISPQIAMSAGDLSSDIHGDPADRLIIATARAFGCPLVTADRQILSYASKGHLAVIDARR
jgi:PIN domain nuclease of toxin-antitoxin system